MPKQVTSTPGPWTYHAKQHDGFDGPSIQSEYGLICSMPTPEDSEGKTNARLIAAAPEMLEACDLALSLLRGHVPHLKNDAVAKLKNAITRATRRERG